MMLGLALLSWLAPIAVHAGGRFVAARALGVGGVLGRDGSVGRRLLVALAGGGASWLFAAALVTVAGIVWGEAISDGRAVIAAVQPGMPGAEAGVRADDEIVAVDGAAVTVETLGAAIDRTGGRSFTLDAKRGGAPLQLTLQARLVGGRYRIGVVPIAGERRVPVGVGRAVARGGAFPAFTTRYIASTLVEAVRGRPEPTFTGPPGIARQLKRETSEPRLYLFAGTAVWVGWLCLLLGLGLALVPQRREKIAAATATAKTISTTTT